MNNIATSGPEHLLGQMPKTKRRIRMVVCGEVKSGKTSVINALLRGQVLPYGFGNDTKPVMLVRHGDESSVMVRRRNGTEQEYDEFPDPEQLSDAALCDVYTNASYLENVEVVELPFYHDGDVSKQTLAVMADADILVWVTIASQAWRLSEKAIVQQLPEELRKRSVIAVSRADKLKSTIEWDKIHNRLTREAGEFFHETVFLSASKKMISSSTTSDKDWQSTGGYVLAQILKEHAETVKSEEPEDETNIVEFSSPRAISSRTPTPSEIVDAAEVVASAHETRKAPINSGVSTTLLAKVRDITRTMNGLIEAGVAACDKDKCRAVFLGEDASTAETASVCGQWYRAQNEAYEFLGDDNQIVDTQISAGNQFFVYMPIEGTNDLVFFRCHSAKINPNIAKTALKRAAHVWQASH